MKLTALSIALLACSLLVACSDDDDANGDDGGCSVTQNDDGSATISCADGTSATVAAGADGMNGTDGMDGMNGTNGMAGMNGTNGMDGMNGTNGMDGTDGMDGVRGSGAILLPGPDFYPEGIAKDANDTLYVGSITRKEILSIASDSWSPQVFVSDAKFTNLIGMIVDGSGVLWFCNSDVGTLAAPTLYGYDTATGTQVAEHAFPGAGFCNDMTFDGAGNLYVTDSFGGDGSAPGGKIFKIDVANLTTNNSLTSWLDDGVFYANNVAGDFSLNGIAFDGTDTLFSVNFTTGEFYQIPINADGSAGTPTVVTLDRALLGGDGVEYETPTTYLVAENFGGALSRVDVSAGTVTTLYNTLDTPATFEIVPNEGSIWVTEMQVDHLLGLDPTPPNNPFRLVRFPIPPAP